MIEFPRTKTIQDSIYTGTWSKSKIPVYTVTSMNGLNQLVGYVKHINAGNGTVLYRGQCELYASMKASICRDPKTCPANSEILKSTIEQAIHDDDIKSFFNFNEKAIKGWELYHYLAMEAVMQHYGAKTFCVDFVDNHWTALWFGLYRWDRIARTYVKRTAIKNPLEDRELNIDGSIEFKPSPVKPEPDTIDDLSDKELARARELAAKSGKSEEEFKTHTVDGRNKKKLTLWEKNCRKIETYNLGIPTIYAADNLKAHMYLFLYVAETDCPTIKGVSFGKETYTIDLRKMLPSVFLRPSSQHGWIVRGCSDDYNFDSGIVCVIRINVDLVADMLGNGTLLSVENFFPSSDYDQGYHVLLERQEDTTVSSTLPTIFPKNTVDTSF